MTMLSRIIMKCINSWICAALSLAVCLLSAQAWATCPANPSCTELASCAPHETFRIPFAKIRECIAEGVDPPRNWKRMQGQGAVNTGGSGGNAKIGALIKPYKPPRNNDPLSGGSDFDFTADILDALNGNEETGVEPVDCSKYVDPNSLGPCDTRGPKTPVNGIAADSCGSSTQLDSEWITLTKNANAAAIATRRANLYDKDYISLYRKSGQSLSFVSKSEIPTYYCEVHSRPGPSGDDEYFIVKYHFKVVPQFSAINPNTKKIALYPEFDLELKDELGNPKPERKEYKSGYIILNRVGNTLNFQGPPPNPDIYDSYGILTPYSGCISLDELITSDLPNGLGDIHFSNPRHGRCEISTYTPNIETEACLKKQQYYDAYLPQLVIPPDVRPGTGNISGGESFSRTTMQGGAGSLTFDKMGTLIYTGPRIQISGADFILGTGVNSVNEQTFINGASIYYDGDRVIRLTPPGRIKLKNDGEMLLIDGGNVESSTGALLRTLSPNSSAAFPANTPIRGTLHGSLAADTSVLLPTNKDNNAQLPYDAENDLVCQRIKEYEASLEEEEISPSP